MNVTSSKAEGPRPAIPVYVVDGVTSMMELPYAGVSHLGLQGKGHPPETLTQAFEATLHAQEDDPELKRKRDKRNADLEARYARWRLNFESAEPQEEVIRDARKYAESYLAEAHSSSGQLVVTRRIWDDFIPKHPKGRGFSLPFEVLHAAVWTEGYPSLEERANAAIRELVEPQAATRSNKRGRKTIFSPDQLERACSMKQSGIANNQIAKLLYQTKTSTAEQRRSVPTILRYHFGSKK